MIKWLRYISQSVIPLSPYRLITLCSKPYKNAQNITNRNLTHILDISYIYRTRSIYISNMSHLYIGHAASIYPIPPIYSSLVRITYTLFSHNMEMQLVIVATVTIYSSYQSHCVRKSKACYFSLYRKLRVCRQEVNFLPTNS